MQPPKPMRGSSASMDGRGSERTDYLADRKGDFLLIEFGKLQDEIQSSIKEIWKTEQTVLLLNILLPAMGFLAPTPINPDFFVLPFVVTFLGGMRVVMVWLHLKRAGNYLTKVEEVFGVHPELGWELRLEKLDESRPFTLSLIGITVIFWVGLLATTLVLAIGFHWRMW